MCWSVTSGVLRVLVCNRWCTTRPVVLAVVKPIVPTLRTKCSVCATTAFGQWPASVSFTHISLNPANTRARGYAHTHTRTHAHTHTRARAHTHMHTKHRRAHVGTHILARAHAYSHIHTNARTHTHTRAHTHTHTHPRTHVYTQIHARTAYICWHTCTGRQVWGKQTEKHPDPFSALSAPPPVSISTKPSH